jgi:hypothetical protein
MVSERSIRWFQRQRTVVKEVYYHSQVPRLKRWNRDEPHVITRTSRSNRSIFVEEIIRFPGIILTATRACVSVFSPCFAKENDTLPIVWLCQKHRRTTVFMIRVI